MAGYLIVLLVVALLQCTIAFTASRSPIRVSRFSLNMVQKEAFQLVLLRHGESSWNKENKFTGWYDCPLSEKGHAEAAAAGALLKEEGKWQYPIHISKGVEGLCKLHLLPLSSRHVSGFVFDVAYTSYLKRAIRTLWHALEQTELMYIPIINAWQLNERWQEDCN